MITNSRPLAPNAFGSASPQTRISTVALSRQARSTGESSGSAFATHTKADHAHQIERQHEQTLAEADPSSGGGRAAP